MDYIDEIIDLLFDKLLTFVSSQLPNANNQIIYNLVKNDYLPHLRTAYEDIFNSRKWDAWVFLHNHYNINNNDLQKLVEDIYYSNYENFENQLYSDLKQLNYDSNNLLTIDDTFKKQFTNCMNIVLSKYYE